MTVITNSPQIARIPAKAEMRHRVYGARSALNSNAFRLNV
jgi:hypothetical protein